MREWIANRLLGLATFVLPADHPAIRAIYDAGWSIDDPEWIAKRDRHVRREVDAAWFSLAMNAAAELESAAHCLQDEGARKSASNGARYYRERTKELWAELHGGDRV